MNIQDYQYIKNGNIIIFCDKNDNFQYNPYEINLTIGDISKKIETNNLIFNIIYQDFFKKMIPDFQIKKEYQLCLDFILNKKEKDILALINSESNSFIAISDINWEMIDSIKNYLKLEQEIKKKTNNSSLKKL